MAQRIVHAPFFKKTFSTKHPATQRHLFVGESLSFGTGSHVVVARARAGAWPRYDGRTTALARAHGHRSAATTNKACRHESKA